ncbi:MAG: GDSL-type esterase/lipase family protein [Oscillospiraceae bacterium]
MNKLKKSIYVLMLLATVVFASPFMVVKIWNSSELKTVADNVVTQIEESQLEDDSDLVNVVPIEVPTPLSPTESPSEEILTAELETEATEPETKPQEEERHVPDSALLEEDDEPENESVSTETEEVTTEAETEPPTEFPTRAIQKVKRRFWTSNKFVKSDVSYFDDALFIGDSRTEDLKYYGTLTGADFFCSVGLSNYKVNTVYVDGMTLSEWLASKKYGKVYIMLGLNEIADNIEYTTGLYRNLVEQVRQAQPTALIFIEGNLHVTDWYSQQNPSESNERLDTYNEIISKLANDRDIFYIDVNEYFDDENGALPADSTGDGIHPYAKFCSDWCDWLCSRTIPYYPPA